MSQSPQFSQDYVIDIPETVDRLPRERIERLERRLSPSQARLRAPAYVGKLSKERIAELERRMSPGRQTTVTTMRPMMPSTSMTMVKPKRKYTKRRSSKKRSSKKRKTPKRKSSKRRSSSCKRGYTSVRTYVRSDTKKRVSRHCSKIGKRRSKK
jgi:hypothetical protein